MLQSAFYTSLMTTVSLGIGVSAFRARVFRVKVSLQSAVYSLVNKYVRKLSIIYGTIFVVVVCMFTVIVTVLLHFSGIEFTTCICLYHVEGFNCFDLTSPDVFNLIANYYNCQGFHF